MPEQKDWPVFDEMPEGWIRMPGAPLTFDGHVWICNGLSILNPAHKRGRLKLKPREPEDEPPEPARPEPQKEEKPRDLTAAERYEVQKAARKAFIRKLLEGEIRRIVKGESHVLPL